MREKLPALIDATRKLSNLEIYLVLKALIIVKDEIGL